MKSAKVLVAAVLPLCLIFGLAGCSSDENWKDTIINDFNDMLQHFSEYALTKDRDLIGYKTKGEDTYTGSYTAEYDGFNGKEYLFGGTGLERDNGNDLTITYKLQVTSGSAKLFWLDKDDESIITEADSADTDSITLNEGDHYLVFEGENFSGALRVTVE